MKQALLFVCLATLALGSFAAAEELSAERQREIVENYMYLRGQRTTPYSAAAADEMGDTDRPPLKCGTPAILEFQRNYASLDRNLVEALGAELVLRPTLSYAYDTPGGHIRLHYDKTGDAAVWQANVDSDGDGVPNYVETLGLIADSVYSYMTDTLGYPPPEVDSAEVGGEDARTDVYLSRMPAGYYGLTWPVYTQFTANGRRTTPGWVEIDNDFQELEAYMGRPLDAARVTLAHELFHLSHFNMDPTEDIAWFEMSSTWMEEQQYDEINDYYTYLPYFFNFPRRSIHNMALSHAYGSVVFPIYLSETYDTDTLNRGIIKSIWLNASIDLGPTFLPAVDHAVDSASGGVDNVNTAFAEFGVWNFFTGAYADQAPNGIGYSEKAAYPYIPLDAMDLRRSYPVSVNNLTNLFPPEPNSAMYMRLENLSTVPVPPVATDSVPRPVTWYVYGESVPGGWGVTAILQSAAMPDSHRVISVVDSGRLGIDVDAMIGDFWLCTKDTMVFDAELGDSVRQCLDSALTVDPSKYRSVTLVFTPTSTAQDFIYDDSLYQYIYRELEFGYYLGPWENAIDSSLLNVPSAVLAPYPNPAVVSEMGGSGLTFRFRLPTDSTTYPAYPTAYLLVDLFTVAGERVTTVEGVFVSEDRTGEHREGVYEAQWNMRNDGGNEVASGVYLACARLFESSDKISLLAEDRVKVAVIR